MDKTQKQLLIILGVVVTIVLLIVAVNMFSSGREKEEKKDEMIDNYRAVDRALISKENCDRRKNSEDCLKMGLYYLNGKHVNVNRKKASKYLLKACNMKNPVGCFQLGKFWQGEREKPGRKARKYFKKACKYGDLEACEVVKEKNTKEVGK